jgi:hypothetical protein
VRRDEVAWRARRIVARMRPNRASPDGVDREGVRTG